MERSTLLCGDQRQYLKRARDWSCFFLAADPPHREVEKFLPLEARAPGRGLGSVSSPLVLCVSKCVIRHGSLLDCGESCRASCYDYAFDTFVVVMNSMVHN